jgi:hypothetical protein
MLADTVDYMNDVKTVKLQVATKMVDLFRRGRRRYSRLNKDIPYTSEISLPEIKLFIIKTFKIWSEDGFDRKRHKGNNDEEEEEEEDEDGGAGGSGSGSGSGNNSFDDRVHSAMSLSTKATSVSGVIGADKGVNRQCLAQKLSAARLHLSKRRMDIIFKLADPGKRHDNVCCCYIYDADS